MDYIMGNKSYKIAINIAMLKLGRQPHPHAHGVVIFSEALQ